LSRHATSIPTGIDVVLNWLPTLEARMGHQFVEPATDFVDQP
jgi:hypothetical protein